MMWNTESQIKLFFMLPLNERCGFPSVHSIENYDLLMMITPRGVPPFRVIP